MVVGCVVVGVWVVGYVMVGCSVGGGDVRCLVGQRWTGHNEERA